MIRSPAWRRVCLMTLLLGPGYFAQEETIECSVVSPFQTLDASFGFAPLLFQIANRAGVEQDVTVVARTYMNSRTVTSDRRTLGAGESALIELSVPLAGAVQCSVETSRSGEIGLPRVSLPRGVTFGMVTVASAPNLAVVHLAREDRGRSTIEIPGFECSVATVPLEHAPARVASYSCVDLLVIEDDLVDVLAPAQREALVGFVEQGGTLVVFGLDARSKSATHFPRGQRPLRRGIAPYVALGLGHIVIIPERRLPEDASGWERALRPLLDPATGGLSKSKRFLPPFDALASASVPGVGDVPVRPFTILMVGMALLIGPFNLWIFRNGRRRSMILVTIPALSLLATLPLLVYAMFVEGLSVRVVPRSITVLDQVTGRAAYISATGYYAGVGRDLVFPEGTVTLFRDDPDHRRQAERKIDMSQGMTLSGAWLPIRTPCNLQLIGSGPCRERVRIGVPDGSGLSLTNELTVRILEIVIRASDGRHYRAVDLAPGSTAIAVLQREGASAAIDLSKVTSEDVLDSISALPLIETIARRPELTPGEYVAVTESPVAVAYGVEGADLLEGLALLIGRFADR